MTSLAQSAALPYCPIPGIIPWTSRPLAWISKALNRSCRAAGAGVLHTWNQRLEHPPYIHFVVPGSGSVQSRLVLSRFV